MPKNKRKTAKKEWKIGKIPKMEKWKIHNLDKILNFVCYINNGCLAKNALQKGKKTL